MNALLALLIVTGIIYGVLYDGTFWRIYFSLVAAWFVFITVVRDRKQNPKRKTITISTWSEPNDPTSYITDEYEMTKALEYIKKINKVQDALPDGVHVTMTHLLTHAFAWGLAKMDREIGRLPWGFF